MDVVDLTLSDDDSPQLGPAARLAGRAPAAATAALHRAAASPAARRRAALSPLHNTHRHASPGEGAASPKPAREAAAAAAERRWGMLIGGGSEDTDPSAASQHAAGGRRKSLQALLAVEDAVAAGGSYQAGQLAGMNFDELLAPPAAGNAARAAGRAARRQRRQGGTALAGLRDMFADDWDGTMLPSSQECAPSQQQQQQPRSRAGSGSLARGASGTLAAEPALRHDLLGCHAGSGGLPASPAAGAAAAGGSQPFAEQAQQQPQRAQQQWQQQQQQEDHWELGNTLADDGDPEWVPGGSQGGRGDRDDRDDDYEPWGAAPEQQPKKKRRGRKTQEEKEAEAADKERRKAEKEREKQLKAAEKEREKAAKKLEREYNSKSGHLKWITVLLDPRLVNCGLGLKIAERLQETQSGDKGDDAVAKDVRDCGLAPYRSIKWLRKVPAQQQQQQIGAEMAGEGAELEGALVDEEMPYVMVCMEAEEFVSEVLRDRLDALLSLLEARCPGYRASLLVCGLAAYLQKREREEGRRALQAKTGELGFVRAPVDDFVAGLAIECPGLGFRDVVDAPQGGEHVLSMTVAIAKEPYKPSEAQQWLLCHGGSKDSQPMKAMLASNPLADSATQAFAHALYGMPVHALNPGVAHAVASRYRSLGALMAMLLDPSRPDAAKIKEIEDMKRTSSTVGARGMRVGPKAAERLFQLLTCANPSLAINPTD